MKTRTHPSLVYDWDRYSRHGGNKLLGPRKIIFKNDETLRDGLQSPSAINPSLKRKLILLRCMQELGIEQADLGLPGAGNRHFRDISRMLKAIIEEKMDIKPSCAVRTVVADIEPIDRLQQLYGIPIRADIFIGTSPIRQFVEGWSIRDIIKKMRESIGWARAHGIPAMFVTEDTTASKPDDVRRLYAEAIELGAMAICLCDTCGRATPEATNELVRFAIEHVIKPSGKKVGLGDDEKTIQLHWHGHNDRGLGLANAFTAIAAGANVIHGTGLGLGERVGNVAMDQILINLKLLGLIDNDLAILGEYMQRIHDYTGAPFPPNYPMGRDAFRTGTGVHASAIIKALETGNRTVADLVYTGVPAHLIGREQEIEVGPMSGNSNVIYWLKKHGYRVTKKRINRILTAAKDSDRLLTDRQLHALARFTV